MIIHTRTQEEYDALMQIMASLQIKWRTREAINRYTSYETDTCINIEDGCLLYARLDFYKGSREYGKQKIISFPDFLRMLRSWVSSPLTSLPAPQAEEKNLNRAVIEILKEMDQ